MSVATYDLANLTQIGWSYSPSAAALTLSALEAAGYDVVMPHFHTHALLANQALALGGIPIAVPASQADDARALLQAIDAGKVIDLETKAAPSEPALRKKSLLWKIVYFVILWKGGAGHNLNQTFVKPQ
ncbi:hypothetical protein KO498_16060 [Lentibacter algarum]|uniref:hypothetical protein n=1 Tax=Lentibacter algarum TaxID=576131 RepID=UPI001C090F50|nr:hypothetical protein [Lentibacter algarum]MBU2983321.1 hypothetical protein [Lentibacter algarum]